jgi:hypothetical protein
VFAIFSRHRHCPAVKYQRTINSRLNSCFVSKLQTSGPNPVFKTNPDSDRNQGLTLANFFKFYVLSKLSYIDTFYANVLVLKMLFEYWTSTTFYDELSVYWLSFTMNCWFTPSGFGSRSRLNANSMRIRFRFLNKALNEASAHVKCRCPVSGRNDLNFLSISKFTMGAKSIARGRFTANYYTLKLVFWQTKVMVLKDSVLTISGKKKNSKISIFRCQKSPFFWVDFFIRRFFVHTTAAAAKFFNT